MDGAGNRAAAQGQDAVSALQQAADLLPEDAELRAGLVEAQLSQGHALIKSGRLHRGAGHIAPGTAVGLAVCDSERFANHFVEALQTLSSMSAEDESSS